MLFYWFWYNCCILAMIKQIFNLASKVLYYMFKSILVFILYRYSAHSKYFHASDMSRWINMVYRIVIFLSLPFPPFFTIIQNSFALRYSKISLTHFDVFLQNTLFSCHLNFLQSTKCLSTKGIHYRNWMMWAN